MCAVLGHLPACHNQYMLFICNERPLTKILERIGPRREREREAKREGRTEGEKQGSRVRGRKLERGTGEVGGGG